MSSIQHKLEEAFCAFDQKEYARAERLYELLLVNLKNEDSTHYDEIMHMLGFVKGEMGKWKESEEIYQSLLTQAKSSHNKEEEAVILHQLGMVFRLSGDIHKSREYFVQEENHRTKNLPFNDIGFSANHYEQGILFLIEKNLENAVIHMNQALQFAEKAEDTVCCACAHRGLGDIYAEMEKLDLSIHHFQVSKQFFKTAEDNHGIKEIEERIDKTKKNQKKDFNNL